MRYYVKLELTPAVLAPAVIPPVIPLFYTFLVVPRFNRALSRRDIMSVESHNTRVDHRAFVIYRRGISETPMCDETRGLYTFPSIPFRHTFVFSFLPPLHLLLPLLPLPHHNFLPIFPLVFIFPYNFLFFVLFSLSIHFSPFLFFSSLVPARMHATAARKHCLPCTSSKAYCRIKYALRTVLGWPGPATVDQNSERNNGPRGIK